MWLVQSRISKELFCFLCVFSRTLYVLVASKVMDYDREWHERVANSSKIALFDPFTKVILVSLNNSVCEAMLEAYLIASSSTLRIRLVTISSYHPAMFEFC